MAESMTTVFQLSEQLTQ